MPDTIADGAVVTQKLMKEISAAFNARDVDRIVSYFAEDGTFLMARGPEPDGRRTKGKDAIRKVLSDPSRSSPTCAGTTSNT